LNQAGLSGNSGLTVAEPAVKLGLQFVARQLDDVQTEFEVGRRVEVTPGRLLAPQGLCIQHARLLMVPSALLWSHGPERGETEGTHGTPLNLVLK
jgi:hypothetical protein